MAWVRARRFPYLGVVPEEQSQDREEVGAHGRRVPYGGRLRTAGVGAGSLRCFAAPVRGVGAAARAWAKAARLDGAVVHGAKLRLLEKCGTA